MKKFSKHISILLLFISGLFIVPKELVHELTFHEDTIDHCSITCEGFAISNIHHHCDILQVFVPPYHASDGTVLISDFTKIISHYSFNVLPVSLETGDSFVIRGPPVRNSFC
ncbi:MAG: hypothetical protein ABI855_08900 [Bacteroidota bacterium]